MAWLEGSALGHVMRDSGVWFYGIINLAHILGVATLFGSVVILDLRLLGFWPDAPLAAISRPTTRMAAAGFCIAAVTGAGLLATKATEYVGNPFLYIKIPALGLALLNVFLSNRSSAGPGRWPGRAVTGVVRPCPVVAARNRVPCPLASAIEASSSMLVAKLGVAD